MRRRFEGATAISTSKKLFVKCRNTHFGPYVEMPGVMINPTILKLHLKFVSFLRSKFNFMATHPTSPRCNFLIEV